VLLIPLFAHVTKNKTPIGNSETGLGSCRRSAAALGSSHHHAPGCVHWGAEPAPWASVEVVRLFGGTKTSMVDPAEALPGREQAMPAPARHEILGTPLRPPFPPGVTQAIFAMGCFWGAERIFWQAPGVYTTAVGYSGGYTPNPTYEEVCSGRTGHAEAVLVAFDEGTSYEEMLKLFWEGHDPTQGMRQGNDVGTQYRSAIFWLDEAQRAAAEASLHAYQEMLTEAGYGAITTELAPAGAFYYAEDYHQQYLAKNPGGYCGLGGTGVACPVGLTTS
jgi:peptide-methionine (S)-S-oxide reductase